MNFDAVGGRRHLLTWACLISANVLCLLGKITGGEWCLIVGSILTIYVGGNTAQKLKTIGAEHDIDRDSKKDNQE